MILKNNDYSKYFDFRRGACYILYMLYKGKADKDFAKAHDLLKDRPSNFYLDENIFLSEKVFSLAEVYSLLEKEILDNYKLKYGKASGEQEIFFQHLDWLGKSEWTSELTVEQKQGNTFRYKFRITHMLTGSRSGDHYFPIETNVCLTMIEKAFLKLDPETLVQRRDTEWKTGKKGTRRQRSQNELITKENAQDLAAKTPLANDYFASPSLFDKQSESAVKIQSEAPAPNKSLLESESERKSKEWLEYFELVNERKPTTDEFMIARKKGEF